MMATTWIEPIWIARECLRVYQQMDALSRTPSELTVVFGESGHEYRVRKSGGPHTEPLLLYIFDCQWTPEMDPHTLLDRVIRPMVRNALKQRGEYSSAFRKYLKASWRVRPLVDEVG